MARGQWRAVKHSAGVFDYLFPYTPQCLPCSFGVSFGHYENTLVIFDAEISIYKENGIPQSNVS